MVYVSILWSVQLTYNYLPLRMSCISIRPCPYKHLIMLITLLILSQACLQSAVPSNFSNYLGIFVNSHILILEYSLSLCLCLNSTVPPPKGCFPDPQISGNFVFLWTPAAPNPSSITVLISNLYDFLFGIYLPQLTAGSRPSGFIYFTTRCQQNALHIQASGKKLLIQRMNSLRDFTDITQTANLKQLCHVLISYSLIQLTFLEDLLHARNCCRC